MLMSGLPAGSKSDTTPNWIVSSWPPETQTILAYQWNEVALPYWRQLADHARLTRPGLKVLFITGYAEQAAMASGFLGSGMEMITKPFAIEDLTSRIRDIIERS